MTRTLAILLTTLALLTFGAAAQADHHGTHEPAAADDPGSLERQADEAAPRCEHAADEPCPHAGDGKQCPHHEGKQCAHHDGKECAHHEGKQCSHAKGEPCDHHEDRSDA